MFNNNNNNSKDNNSVNTKGPQFMNKDGFDPSTVLIGFWDRFLTIKIHPALPNEKRSETKIFDYEKVVSTALTLEKITLLINDIEKYILPAIESGEDKTVGVPVGADSILVVGTGKKITGSIRPFLAIHKSLNEKTKKPEMSICYEFNRIYTVHDYDPVDGTFDVNKDQHGELFAFVEILKASRIGLSNTTAHASRYVDKYYKDTVLKNISSVAEKLGVSLGNGQGKYYNKRNDLFNDPTGASDNSSSTSMNVESLNNINEIDDFLS
jgi:hypothetical protein